MSEKSAFFLFIMGLLMTGFGVGGVEQSISNYELFASVVTALTGLSIMGCGVLAIKTQNIG